LKPLYFSVAQSQIALSIKAAATLAITLAIYFQDLTLIANEALQSDLMSYLLAVPFLYAYLIYRRRKMVRATVQFETTDKFGKPKYTSEIVGSLLCLTGFLLCWGGSYTFYPLEYHMLSLPIFAAGLILIIFNAKTLQVLAFPIVFLFLLTPPPSELVAIWGASVATLSSNVSYGILKAVGFPVTQITEYGAPVLALTDPSGSQISFVIDVASSGIYSIIGFSIFAVFIMYVARGPIWKKATACLASISLIYILTIVRIMILILVGHWQGTNTAWNIFHLLGASAFILLGTIILLTLSEKIWKLQIFIRNPKPTPCPTCNPNTKNNEPEPFCPTCGKIIKNPPIKLSKQDVGKIIILILITGLIATISVPVFALSEQPPEVLMQTIGKEQATTATEIFPKIPNYNLTFIYRDTQFEKIAKRDRALAYAYKPKNTSSKTIYVAMEIGSLRATWHSWEACIITWPQTHGLPPSATQLDLREVQLLQNPPLIGKFFAYQPLDSNTTRVVLYWYENAVFKTDSGSQQKYVKISLIVYLRNQNEITETENQLTPIAKAIINHWQPIKTWSQIALTIAQNGTQLTTIPATLIATITIVQIIQKQNKKKTKTKIYNQLTLQNEKHILQAVQQASQTKKPTTTSEIALQYQKITGNTIPSETLTETLKQAEQSQLVKRDITSNLQEEPIITWKNQIHTQKQQ